MKYFSYFFFSEYSVWHFKQIVSYGDNLLEKSKHLFSDERKKENKKTKKTKKQNNLLSASFGQGVLKVWKRKSSM